MYGSEFPGETLETHIRENREREREVVGGGGWVLEIGEIRGT